MFYSYLIQAIVTYVTIIVSIEMSNEYKKKIKEIKKYEKIQSKKLPTRLLLVSDAT